MPDVDDIIASMRRSQANIRFGNLKKVCDDKFGKPRNNGSSHYVYTVDLPNSPTINIQPDKSGKAKPYQVKQVLKAIEQMEGTNETEV